MDKRKSFFTEFSPFKQGIVFGFLMILAVLSVLLYADDLLKAWENMATIMLFYTIMNTLISLKIKNNSFYYRKSLFVFFILLLLGYGVSFVVSGKHVTEVYSMVWILGLFSFIYVLISTIVRAMRFIMEYLQAQNDKLINNPN